MGRSGADETGEGIAALPAFAPRQAIESRAGIESLDELQHHRRQLIEAIKPLDMLFGSGGDRWTAKRRRHRDGIAKLLRAEMEAAAKVEGKPFKEPAMNHLEMLANADLRHVAFCEKTEASYAEWLELKTLIDETNERIASRELEMRYLQAELRLQQ